MIDVATLSVIRRWALREQLSIREIARRTGLSRNTIRKYLRAGEAEPHYAKRVSPSKLDPFALKLAGWLKTEAGRSRKQRRTIKQMYVDLQALGYGGSYNRVAAFARLWHEQRLVAQQTTGRGTFVPLAFGPGEAFQFDWSEDWAVLDGVRSLAEPLGLPCSGRPTMQALQAVWRQSAGEAVSPTFIQTSQPAQNPGLFMSRQTIKSAPQNTDQPVNSDNSCSARVPSSELPNAFRPGDQTAIDACPGTTARMPPPTPLLPGKPTE